MSRRIRYLKSRFPSPIDDISDGPADPYGEGYRHDMAEDSVTTQDKLRKCRLPTVSARLGFTVRRDDE